ncbi:MAG: hypothetical protein QGG89_17345 [Vicinamibacterales bacterium]|nr:hypothetical protein [Vicinamibacterales bacterium]
MTEVTMKQVLTALQQTPDGRIQLELATQRAIITAQQQEIAALTNGHAPEMVETVLEPPA